MIKLLNYSQVDTVRYVTPGSNHNLKGTLANLEVGDIDLSSIFSLNEKTNNVIIDTSKKSINDFKLALTTIYNEYDKEPYAKEHFGVSSYYLRLLDELFDIMEEVYEENKGKRKDKKISLEYGWYF